MGNEEVEVSKEEYDAYVDRLAHLIGLGSHTPVTIEDGVPEAINAHVASPEGTAKRRDLHALVGELLSATATMEQAVNIPLTYLLDPSNQAGSIDAVKGKTAGDRVKLLKSTFPVGWRDGNTLITEIQRVIEMRNVAAHSAIWTFRILKNGKVIYGSWFGFLNKSDFSQSYKSFTAEQLKEYADRAEFLSTALVAVADLLAVQQDRPLQTDDELALPIWTLMGDEGRTPEAMKHLRTIFPGPRTQAFLDGIKATGEEHGVDRLI